MTDDLTAPAASRPYLTAIERAAKSFEPWHDRCDKIDKLYSDLDALADNSGDREFQIFWANMEVVRPTIYQRPPVPAVQPRHRDNRPLFRESAEFLERVLSVDVDLDHVHDVLVLVRDDLALSARGVAWVLDNGSVIHVDRRDFVHDAARTWREVGWVARRAYLTRDEVARRFGAAEGVQFAQKPKDLGEDYDGERKAAIWEVWDKRAGRVVWATEGVDTVLDERPPLIEVDGFFPCPRPAYGTLQRRSLIPVPDYIYYRDQVDEINTLTARIAGLSESLRLKGFYASGASEIGETIRTLMARTDDKAILVGVSSLAALGGSLKDSVMWLPVVEVATTIASLIQLRQQLIQDVYEISGLSDIMRGSTDANETATAQNLKAQYGSVRVRERQGEMVRIARDILRIKAEIYAETWPIADLAAMAQSELPMEAQPDPAQQQPVTLRDVDALLKSQRLRPFILDIETDSTIAANEDAEKQARTEFLSAVAGFIAQAGPMVAQIPETGPFAAAMLRFTASSFRAGRELGGEIDRFAELVEARAAQAGQQQGPSPEQQKMQAEAEMGKARLQLDQQKAQADIAAKQQEAALKLQIAQVDLQIKQAELQIKREELRLKGVGMALELENRVSERKTRSEERSRIGETLGNARDAGKAA